MYLGVFLCGMTCSATKRRAVRALVRRYTPETVSEMVMDGIRRRRDTDLRRLRGIPTEEQRRPTRSRFLYQRSEHLENSLRSFFFCGGGGGSLDCSTCRYDV
jgi:hypothetical protein